MTLPYQSTSRNVQSVPDFDKPSVIIVDGANIAIASEFINVNDKKTEKDRRIYSITKLSPNTRKEKKKNPEKIRIKETYI